MKRKFILSIAVLSVLALLGFTYASRTAHAQSDRAQGGPPEIIPHRINEHGADSFAQIGRASCRERV